MADTSSEARASITPEEITRLQGEILQLLARVGPMTDEEITLQIHVGTFPTVPADSSIRTRRSELVTLGKVEDSGERRPSRSGRAMTVWRSVVVSPIRHDPGVMVESGMRPNSMPGRPDRYVNMDKARSQANDQHRRFLEDDEAKKLKGTAWLDSPPRVAFGDRLCTNCDATGGNKLDGPCFACAGTGVLR
jgi:hypothetical protein